MGEWGEANHEKMQPRKRNHVDSELAKIGVELPWEAKASGNPRHDSGDQVVKVAIRWIRQLEGTCADVVQCL